MIRLLSLALAALVLFPLSVSGEPPLHQQIDALVEAGPGAKQADDLEFLRQSLLDIRRRQLMWLRSRLTIPQPMNRVPA